MTGSGPANSTRPTPAAPVAASSRLSPEDALAHLSQVNLLHALPPEEIRELVPYLDLVVFAAGQQVFAQGDAGDALYVVDEGSARILRDGAEIGRAERGEVFF